MTNETKQIVDRCDALASELYEAATLVLGVDTVLRDGTARPCTEDAQAMRRAFHHLFRQAVQLGGVLDAAVERLNLSYQFDDPELTAGVR